MKESCKLSAKGRIAQEIESNIEWLMPSDGNKENLDEEARARLKLWEVALKAIVNYDFPATF